MSAPSALDAVLDQAIVCAYAVPGVGAVAAGGISVLQAIIDAARPQSTPPATYSLALAIADLGDQIKNGLAGLSDRDAITAVAGWQDDLVGIKRGIAKGPSSTMITDAESFARDTIYHDKIEELSTNLVKSAQQQVDSLGGYFAARTTYHLLCQAYLTGLALAQGSKDPERDWALVDHDVRDRYDQSLVDALTYARPLVEALDAARTDIVAAATAATTRAAPGGDPDHAVFSEQVRLIRTSAHLVDAESWKTVPDAKVDQYVGIVQALSQTLAGLRLSPVPKHPAGTTPAGRPVLGQRRPGTMRFLFETSASGDRIGVLADSTAVPGGVATQCAGSVAPGTYYRFDGEFATELTAAGQLNAAQTALAAAYGTTYGDPSAWATDSAARRTDRRTSLIVPLAPGRAPVGTGVFAVVYSVGPTVDAAHPADQKAYKALFADAFAAISEWNATKVAAVGIANLRVVLPATDADTCGLTGLALDSWRATAAGWVIDAAKEAAVADQTLAGLTLLVNSSDHGARIEHVAFDAAAAARKLTTFDQGFDVPLS